MIQSEKLTKILVQAYREVYSAIGVDFDAIDKVQDFFLDYYLCDKEQEKILNRVINSHKLKTYERQCIKNSYWLGISPASSPKSKRNK